MGRFYTTLAKTIACARWYCQATAAAPRRALVPSTWGGLDCPAVARRTYRNPRRPPPPLLRELLLRLLELRLELDRLLLKLRLLDELPL